MGLSVTINSDDPTYFGGDLNENYQVMFESLRLSLKDTIVNAKMRFKTVS